MVKGYFKKKNTTDLLKEEKFKLRDEIENTSKENKKAIESIEDMKQEIVSTVNEKLNEIDNAIEQTEEFVVTSIENLEKGLTGKIQDLSTLATEAIKNAKLEEIDEARIADSVMSKIRIPEDGKDADFDEEAFIKKITAKFPNEKAMVKKILSSLPSKKGDLKIIQEKVEVDPMSVIEKIMELPEDKFKLKSSQIDGLEQTISAFRTQLSRGYLHGGGLSNITGLIEAGTNVTISGSGTKESPYVINATGGGGSITLETDGTPNGDQTLLNLISGTNIAIHDDGFGGITIDATGGGTPAGAATEIQFNDGMGGFGADSRLAYNSVDNLLYVDNIQPNASPGLNINDNVGTTLINVGNIANTVHFPQNVHIEGVFELTTLTPSLPLKLDGSGRVLAEEIALDSAEVSGVLPIANGGTELGTLGTALQYIRVNAGATALEYATLPASGANTALSNLASVAINTSLISDTTNTDDLGSSSILWRHTYTTDIELGNGSDTTLTRSAAGVLAVEGVVIPSISSTNTLTNKRITKRTATTNAPGATPTTNTDNVDLQIFTGLGTAITSMTTNLSGTPAVGDLLRFWLTDDGTARAITWGASFAASGTVSLPTTTVISTTLIVGFEWTGSLWRCIAKA